MWLAYTQPTIFTKAWKMNGLAFENVNYREIQLTPGARKDTPVSVLSKKVDYVFVPIHTHTLRRRGVCEFNPKKMYTHTHRHRGTIKH